MRPGPLLEGWMKDAGFTNVQAKKLPLAFGPWPKDKAAKEAGLEGISSHTLRKTWGYCAYKAGVDIAFLQHFFNHSTPAKTLKYLGIAERKRSG